MSFPTVVYRLRRGVIYVAGREHYEYVASVNSLPDEVIVDGLVGLAPEELCGKEVIYAALLEYLRKCRGIAEYVGKPENDVLLAELLAHKAFAEKYLSHKALAADDICVSLKPHSTLCLPATFGDACLDLLVEHGVVFLYVLIKLGLARHKDIVGILLHKANCGREGALCLFLGLRKRPKPRNVDVRVSEHRNNALVVAADLVIELVHHKLASRGNALVILDRVATAQIEQHSRAVEHVHYLIVVHRVLR